MPRYQKFQRIWLTATRILYYRDPDNNRTAAYERARDAAEVIALRCVRG